MNFDYSSLLGTGLLLTLVVSAVAWIVGLVVFYLVTRAAVSHGLRSHQIWMEKHRPGHTGQHSQEVAPPQ